MMALLTLLILLLASPAFATSYYVTKSGSGTTCSQNNPCGTIATGVGKLSAGDTLFIGGGTYNETFSPVGFRIPSGNDENSRVTISGNPGETVYIPGQINIQGNFDGSMPQYLTLNNLTSEHLDIAATSNHITVSNSDFTGINFSGSGVVSIARDTDYVKIVNTKMHGGRFDFSYSNYSGAYGCYCNGQHMEFDGVQVYDNYGYGMNLYLSGGGVENILLKNSVFHDNCFNDGLRNQGLNVVIFNGGNNLMYNNIFYNNSCIGSGAVVTTSPGVGGFAGDNNRIYNNVFYNNPNGPAVFVNEGNTNTDIRNNIFYLNNGTIENYGSNTTTTPNITSNPSFVDAANLDFHIIPGSPAQDSGVAVSGATTDIVGVFRPQGNGWDQGVYEITAASPPPAPPPTTPLLAFPTAEGYGAYTVGGRGGRIVRVTNLNDSGVGSLRNALSVQTGPRIVVFDVSGTITLTSGPIVMLAANSNVTIAGQTSPGGVQVKGDGIFFKNGAHDLIMRHMRMRPGTKCINDNCSVNPPDCNVISCDTNGFIDWAENDITVYNVIIDHSSFEWSTDQNGPDAFHSVRNMTAQYNIIANGTNTGHSNGFPNHNLGILISSPHASGFVDPFTSVVDPPGSGITYTLHHNLFANLGGRAPLIGRVDTVDVRNNIVYNTGSNGALQWGSYLYQSEEYPCYDPGATAFGNFVNNLYLEGPAGQQRPYLSIMGGGPTRLHGNPADRGGSRIYTQGNWGPYCPTGCANDWDNFFYNLDSYQASTAVTGGGCAVIADQGLVQATEAQFRASTAYATPAVTTHSPGQLVSLILPAVGAYKPSRDSVDTGIVNNVLNGTGDPNGIGAGGPWPTLTGGAPPTDTDGDGIPDTWEVTHGLNPNDPTDGNATALNGYTNVENYLNELAGDGQVIPPPPPQIGTVFHVAQTGGSDSRSCTQATDPTTPLLTLGAGIACMTQLSSTLYLHTGTYVEAIDTQTQFIPSGSSWTAPTLIKAYGTDIVTLRNPAGVQSLIYMRNASRDRYIIFDRLILDCNNVAGSNAFVTYPGTHHIRFQNGEMKNCAYEGAFLYSANNVEILNSLIHNNPSWYGIALAGTIDSVILNKNQIYSNGRGGIDLMKDPSGVPTNTTITQNKIHNNSTSVNSSGIRLGSAGNVGNQVYNNLIYGEYEGITLGSGANGSKIYNNTIYGSTTNGINVTSAATGTLLINNISYGNSGTAILNNGTNTTQTTNQTTNPSFTNAGAADFSLIYTSDAIDTGTNLTDVPFDIVDIARPQRTTTSKGAYEFVGTPGTPPPPPPPPLEPPTGIARYSPAWSPRFMFQ